ncbi:hypothetical protein ISP17_11375 [Dyella ginsengisoli]|uniref:Mor transcription activator domain-containing protein n=1 Tax=Dyella ginsengisoli TaxID=363848 RepID=A0ABW8JXQ7_9GAMM
MPHLDLLSDIFQRLQARMRKVPNQVIEEVEQEVRDDWGGERVYIPRRGETGRMQMEQRNRAIRADYHRGERAELLARRYGISIKRVRQIVSP